MVFYFVQRGETLYTIAKRYQTTVHAIVAANRLEDPNAICPGQALIIPKPGEVPSPPPGGIVHLVRPGETVFHLEEKFGTAVHEILRANQIAHPEFILPGQQLVIPEQMEVGDDWPMLGRTPGRAGTSPVVLAGQPVDGWTYTPRKLHQVPPSAPVIRYDRVYVGLGDGYVYSIDRNTGRMKWRFSVGGAGALEALAGRPLATPAVFDGLVYMAGADGSVYAVDAYSGGRVWRVATSGCLTSSPAVAGGLVYVGSGDGHVYALEAKTGALAWKQPLGSPVWDPVALGDDYAYAISDTGLLHAFDMYSGEVCWKQAAGTSLPPVFAELVVLVGGRAYDPRGGHLVWEVEAGVGPPVARVDELIYPDGTVDLFSGRIRKGETEGSAEAVVPKQVSVRHAVAAGPLVLGAGDEDTLVAYYVSSGEPAWSVSVGGPVVQPPAVTSGQVLVTLGTGAMKSFRLKVEKQDRAGG